MDEFQASLTCSFASRITENPVALPHTTRFIKITEFLPGWDVGVFFDTNACRHDTSKLNKMKWRNSQKLSRCQFFLIGFYREQPRFNWRKGKKRFRIWNDQKRESRQDDVFLGEGSPRLNSMCQGKITHSHRHMISSALQETGFYLTFGNIILETFLICL